MWLALILLAVEPDSSVDSLPDGKSLRMQIEGVINAPIEQLDAIIGDPQRYNRWIPIFRSALPDKPLYFDTVWVLPWPIGTVNQYMRFERKAIDTGFLYLFEQTRGDMNRHVGLWALTRIDATHTSVLYQAEVAFRTWLPRFLIAGFQRKELPKLFVMLELELRRRFPHDAREAVSKGK